MYPTEISHISVIGPIWMPECVCAMDYTLTPFDIDNMSGKDVAITREHVRNWIDCHSGDFQYVTDFSATIGNNGETLEFPWASDESEMTYCDAMYGNEE